MLYLIVFFLFFVFAAIEIVGFPRKRYDNLHFFAGTIIVLIAGFRYETGVDWLAYEYIFDNTASLYDAFIINDYTQVFYYTFLILFLYFYRFCRANFFCFFLFFLAFLAFNRHQ